MYELKIEQQSHEWHKARWGIVTGTSLHRVVDTAKKQKTFFNELIAQRMTQVDYDDYQSPAMERGCVLEPEAIKLASKLLGNKYRTTGMIMSSEIEGFGMSPDAVSDEGDKVVSGIEIKCLSSKNHIGIILDNEIPKEYKHQVYSPFLISDDVKFWDFMSYDDRNGLRPYHIIRTHRGDIQKELDEMRPKLIKFLASVKTAHTSLVI